MVVVLLRRILASHGDGRGGASIEGGPWEKPQARVSTAPPEPSSSLAA